MRFEHVVRLAATRAAVWPLVLDVPRIARCVPGVEEVAPVDGAGGDRYRGVLRVSVGPVRLRLEGNVAVTSRDESVGTATLRLDASDRGIGGTVRADLHMTLAEDGTGTDLRMATEATLAGRIGDLGQAIVRRKADQLVAEFARCLERTLATTREERP